MIVAVLLTFSMSVTLFQILPIGSQEVGEYDPWLDWDGDGNVNMREIGRTARAFGTSGDPTRSVWIEGYGWNMSSYSIEVQSNETGNVNITTGGYEEVTLGFSSSNPVDVSTGFLLGSRYIVEDILKVGEHRINESHPANSLWIQPSVVNTTGISKFNVTVWVNVADPAFTWQVELFFNTTCLNATRIGFTAGATSQFFAGHSTIPVTPTINNDEGYVIHGESLLGLDSATGYGSLMWVEFEALEILPSTIDFSSSGTFILDLDLNEISINTYNCAVNKAPAWFYPLPVHYVAKKYVISSPTLTIKYYNPNNESATLEIGAYLSTRSIND